MSIRASLERVLSEYPAAVLEPFAGHSLASFIRNELRDAIAVSVGDQEHLVLKGSAGQGIWARGPWVGIFDPLITTSAQKGYYTSFLFREDMHGVYLSLNQAMTEAKAHYKADAKTALKARAANFRAILGDQVKRFPELVIDLAPSAPSNDTSFYEAGNICAIYYPADNLPSEESIVDDLRVMLRLYESLIVAGTDQDVLLDAEGDVPAALHEEDATRFRLHKRIERNAKLIKEVKKRKGCRCEVCGLDFGQAYGVLGQGYIEAHHLKPLASLKGTKVAMDPEKDFAVLCANCHRMVHRSGLLDDMTRFQVEHFHGKHH